MDEHIYKGFLTIADKLETWLSNQGNPNVTYRLYDLSDRLEPLNEESNSSDDIYSVNPEMRGKTLSLEAFIDGIRAIQKNQTDKNPDQKRKNVFYFLTNGDTTDYTDIKESLKNLPDQENTTILISAISNSDDMFNNFNTGVSNYIGDIDHFMLRSEKLDDNFFSFLTSLSEAVPSLEVTGKNKHSINLKSKIYPDESQKIVACEIKYWKKGSAEHNYLWTVWPDFSINDLLPNTDYEYCVRHIICLAPNHVISDIKEELRIFFENSCNTRFDDSISSRKELTIKKYVFLYTKWTKVISQRTLTENIFPDLESLKVLLEELKTKITTFYLKKRFGLLGVKKINILMFGRTGVGKSSLVNSIFSIFQDVYVQICGVSNQPKSYTKTLKRVILNEFITLFDIFGIEPQGEEEDIVYNFDDKLEEILDGKILENVEDEKKPSYIGPANLGRAVHGVIYVIDSNALREDLDKHKQYLMKIKAKRIPISIFITKFDADLKLKPSEIYDSSDANIVMQNASDIFRDLGQIFPVINLKEFKEHPLAEEYLILKGLNWIVSEAQKFVTNAKMMIEIFNEDDHLGTIIAEEKEMTLDRTRELILKHIAPAKYNQDFLFVRTLKEGDRAITVNKSEESNTLMDKCYFKDRRIISAYNDTEDDYIVLKIKNRQARTPLTIASLIIKDKARKDNNIVYVMRNVKTDKTLKNLKDCLLKEINLKPNYVFLGKLGHYEIDQNVTIEKYLDRRTDDRQMTLYIDTNPLVNIKQRIEFAREEESEKTEFNLGKFSITENLANFRQLCLQDKKNEFVILQKKDKLFFNVPVFKESEISILDIGSFVDGENNTQFFMINTKRMPRFD